LQTRSGAKRRMEADRCEDVTQSLQARVWNSLPSRQTNKITDFLQGVSTNEKTQQRLPKWPVIDREMASNHWDPTSDRCGQTLPNEGCSLMAIGHDNHPIRHCTGSDVQSLARRNNSRRESSVGQAPVGCIGLSVQHDECISSE
ncbi:hypothetical protein BaRGS_00028969, partial [Batillaria attramentaria]